MKSTLIAFIALVSIALAAWFFLSKESPDTPSAFVAEGNLARNNPGYERDAWYLIHEEPGFPAISVKLEFDAQSLCRIGSKEGVCDMSFVQGDRAFVEGTRIGERVVVSKLALLTAQKERNVPIRLYFYDPEKDLDEYGNVRCSQQGLVPVERILPHTVTPLADAIKLLIRGEISDEERAQGVRSEFPLIEVRLEKATIAEGVATLTFSDPKNQLSGGSCRVVVLWEQVKATAKQFPGVKEVRFMPEHLFQP